MLLRDLSDRILSYKLMRRVYYMKCPSCGADIKEGAKFCEFCGNSISADMKRDQEYVNKAGCPKCGSSNISFNREKQGEIRGKKGTSVVRSTVGFCKDCGHTWHTAGSSNQPQKNNMVWWVLGWIFFFPAPVMVLIWRKKCKWDIKVKIGVTVAFWILFFIIGGTSNSESSTSKTESVDNSSTSIENAVEDTISTEKHIYDNAEIVDLMNGTGTDKIGTITVIKAKQSECNEDALTDWYVNYVKKNSDCNFHVIAYTDVEDKGVYSNALGFIQKDITLISEDNGTYSVGDDAGSTYYDVDETAKKLTVRFTMADASIIEEVKSQVDSVIPDEYKSSDMYAVDVSGGEGSLDCNLTLINAKFAGGDCQKTAEEIATKVKNLDLGIGYFCIAFQSDDYTMTAISSVDDLNNQEAAEISTKTFE